MPYASGSWGPEAKERNKRRLPYFRQYGRRRYILNYKDNVNGMRDRNLANSKRYYENHPEELKKRQRKYYLTHIEEKKKRSHEYYMKHREEILKQQKEYKKRQKTNPKNGT